MVSEILMFHNIVFNHRYEGALDPWLTSLWYTLYQIDSKFFPNGPDFLIPNDKLIDQPKIQITYHATDVADLSSSNSGDLNL